MPDWANANEDRTFGNRFDDSEGYFRVLYAASTRLGCFIETLARFRKAGRALRQDLEEISNSDSDHISIGTVPSSWLRQRSIGRAVISGRCADIYRSEWLSYLRDRLESELSPRDFSGFQEFDLALLLSQRRQLTQKASTLIEGLRYDGIYYQSRHGSELYNWAIFEPFELKNIAVWGSIA